jgi:2-polyprenyl-6-methoxyphenol hydroxylase-like FAD-dependent oxidoreductase
MRATVIGGGIAGLACAVAIRRLGWQVEVLERSGEFTEIGAGLSVWPNALRALDQIGLGDRVRELANLDGTAGIRDQHGRWLSRTDMPTLEHRFGAVAMIHRATLLDILRTALPASALRSGTTVHAVGASGTVRHSAGESRADLVVGADGIRSVTRRSLWPDTPGPRYVGYTAWRMVTREPVRLESSSESWGRGERFGYAALADGRAYCFAVANAKEGSPGGGIHALRERFADWHDPIPSLLAAVDDQDLLHHDLFDLPPLPSFVTGKAALVGDAAHAMTPNLGQGACQALEDAVVLAQAVAEDDIAAFDQRRRPRAQMVSQRSARLGRVAQWHSPVAVAIRNAALRALPQPAVLRSLEPVLDWRAEDGHRD